MNRRTEKEKDDKHNIKTQFKSGLLSAFTTQNLLRVYEVIEEQESIQKLHIHNRKRLHEINEALDMTNRKGKALRKKDFETY